MTSSATAWAENVRWEIVRLHRSRRLALLLIPLVAGPVGSAVADRYLALPSPGTAEVLGLLVTAGLAALVALDLAALAIGEDLALHADFFTLVLPQPKRAMVAGRLVPPLAGALAAYLAGAALVVAFAPLLVTASPGAAPPPLDPGHLFWGLAGFLLLLGGVAAAAAAVTRSASQGLVVGVLTGVVAAGLSAELLVQGTLTVLAPVAMAIAGAAALAVAVERAAAAPRRGP